MANQVKQREWEYSPVPDGEWFTDQHGNLVLGWHDRSEEQDELVLLAEFEAYAADEFDIRSLTLRPILARTASDVECRINGWEEGTFVRCTTRARKSWPMWQIEVDLPESKQDGGES